MNSEAAAQEQTARAVQDVLDAGRAGDHARAAALAEAALESGARHPLLFRIRGAARARSGRFDDALSDFEILKAWTPGDAMLHDMIGHCLTMLGRPRDAVAAFDTAIALAPTFAEAHFHKAIALGQLNELEEMRRSYEEVVAHKPEHVEALAGLAYLEARAGNAAAARTHAGRALASQPGQPMALVALAIADIGEGADDDAKSRLQSVLDAGRHDQQGRLNMALGFAADAWDRNGRTAEAFALYRAVNERRRALHAERFADARAIDDVRRQIAYFASCAPWPAHPHHGSYEGRPAGHVFLLGFVRSGTTLLETILASHPGIVAVDEIDFLADAAHNFLRTDEDLDDLAKLDGPALDPWREAYWAGVEKATTAQMTGKVFVDKMPLNSLRLPLIARLFPDARIILAIRDPRDVVFSTFRHRFNIYPSSFEFLRLDDCAHYYAAVMELVARSREKLPLAMREHRYEDMVRDFETAVQHVCSFIGIEWSDAMREFTTAAGVIDRRSQSAAQVSRGLYRGAEGQWRRYKEQLAPVLPILEPWVRRFGYAED